MGFKRIIERGVGTTPEIVGSYSVASNTVSTIIGMSLSNVSNTAIDCSVFLKDVSNNDVSIVSGAPIPVGSTLVVVGGSQKLVLETGDSISVVSSANTSVDVVISLLEVEE